MTINISGASLSWPDNLLPGRVLKTNAEVLRSQMAQAAFDPTPIQLTHLRVWDAMNTNLSGTAAADDLALVTGTPGTDALTIEAGDVKTLNSSRKAGFTLEIPGNFDTNESIEVRIRAGMETTVADTSCTVDLEAWLPNGSGGVGSDIVSTAAQSMNSLTPADYDFEISSGTVSPGNSLMCVVTIAYNDASSVTAVTPVIYAITRRVDVRG